MTDPIADMLTRIRNAFRLRTATVVMPYSKVKHTIATILQREGWIAKAERVDGKFPQLQVTLRYAQDGSSVIRALKRVSTPGHRVYVSKDQLPVVVSHTGVAIISTSSGMMTNKEARKRGVGGEVICEVS